MLKKCVCVCGGGGGGGGGEYTEKSECNQNKSFCSLGPNHVAVWGYSSALKYLLGC